MTPKQKAVNHLRALAALYSQGGDENRAYSFDNAATALQGFPDSLPIGILSTAKVKGIGPSTVQEIAELFRVGKTARLNNLQAKPHDQEFLASVIQHGLAPVLAGKVAPSTTLPPPSEPEPVTSELKVTPYEVKGDHHVHTKSSDGRMSGSEVVMLASDLGYEFIRLVDHTVGYRMPSLDADGVRRWQQRNAMLQDRMDIRVYSALEVDVLSDGQLAFDVPAGQDWIAALHAVPSRNTAERILAALASNPWSVAHISSVTPSKVWDRVAETLRRKRIHVELNARHPCDDSVLAWIAKEELTWVCVSDAHGIKDFHPLPLYTAGIIARLGATRFIESPS